MIAIALLAGLAVGFAGSTLAYRYGLLNVPGERPMERMVRELKLTPAQHDQVAEVMESTRDRVQEARHDFQHQRRRILVDAYTRVRALLTPDQQKEFDSKFVPPRIRAEAEQAQGGESPPPPTP